MTTTPNATEPCHWCGTPTTKRPRHGRRTYPHRCPHGQPCPRAHPLHLHTNHYPLGGPGYCEECMVAYYARERAARGGIAQLK